MRANADMDANSVHPSGYEPVHLESLSPKFDEQKHGFYFDLLTRALNKDGVTNVALTGAYGVGKSSVLEKLSTDPDYKSRVVNLSVSTIAPSGAARNSNQHADGSGDSSRGNLIQKEIVKQLLYSTKPEQVPQSRYRRTSVPHRWPNVLIGLGVGLGVWLIVFLLGIFQPLISAAFPNPFRQALVYVLSAGVLFVIAWVTVGVVRSRPAVSASLGAAATTITLNTQTDTYFDEYLDEIVYVFQVTRRDIVIIEDIDRFDDLEILDALRALNSLLNGSRQLSRRIIFIYAIRDSVFEKIDKSKRERKSAKATATHPAERALGGAGRTKFFNLIIPVVPFVSADNARDLMSEVMASDQFRISPALIRLAARHVADMRLIRNIRNEFEVYRNLLVVPDDHIPGISDDFVFAIVLYKNVHLEDFERIRTKASSLDHLYAAWRTLVRRTLTTSAIPALTTFSSAEHLRLRRNARAKQLAKRLLELRDDLEAATPATQTVTLSPSLSDLESPDTWSEIANDDKVEFSMTSRGGVSIPLVFSNPMLGRLLGADIDPTDWEPIDDSDVAVQLAELENEVEFLRHHTWQQLIDRPDITVPTTELTLEPSEKQRLDARAATDPDATFADLVTAIIPSELCRDLVRNGYLNAYFASYASVYYGKHLSPAARDYIYRYVDPGDAEATFALTRKDVRQLLREQGAQDDDDADIFADRSILNVNIVDYLLKERPDAAANVARFLGRHIDEQRQFLDTYMAQGKRPAVLLTAMSEHWLGALIYAAASNSIADADRVEIVDSLLGQLPAREYDVNDEVRGFLESNYPQLNSLMEPNSSDLARAALGTMSASGAQIDDLAALNDVGREVAIDLQMYPVTATNLHAIVPGKTVGLDSLLPVPAAYQHAQAHLSEFVALAESAPRSFRIVVDPEKLTVVLNGVQSANPDLLTRVVSSSPVQATVASIASVPTKFWPALALARRISTTFENVDAYVAEMGIDANLKSLLAGGEIEITSATDLNARVAMSYTILDSADEIPSTLLRVKLAQSLSPGVLDPTKIDPHSGDLPARLIKAKLLDDDAITFASPLMLDWATLEKAIKSSKAFATFVTPTILPSKWVGDYLRSQLVSTAEDRAVITNLQDYLASGTPTDARAIANALIAERWRIATSRMIELRTAGATVSQVVQLINAHGDDLTLEKVSTVTSALGGDYARLAAGGLGRPKFPDDTPHMNLLRRYEGTTVRRIETKKFKIEGSKLIAHLK